MRKTVTWDTQMENKVQVQEMKRIREQEGKEERGEGSRSEAG